MQARPFLGASAVPFAEIEFGFGNNGVDRTEGVWRNSCIGTYLHGSILPNNAQLLDWLFEKAIKHRISRDSNFDSLVLERMSEYSKLSEASEFARTADGRLPFEGSKNNQVRKISSSVDFLYISTRGM